MNKPRVVIVANTEKTAQIIYNQMKALLGNIIDFEYFSYEKGITSFINANLVLVPTQEMAGIITKLLNFVTITVLKSVPLVQLLLA